MFTHINILTKNLNRSAAFYEDLFDAKLVYKLGEHKRAYLIGDFEFYISEDGGYENHKDMHLGIRTQEPDFSMWLEKVRSRGIPLVKGNNPSAGVHQMDAHRKAFYFEDPDGLTIEVYTPDAFVKEQLGLN